MTRQYLIPLVLLAVSYPTSTYAQQAFIVGLPGVAYSVSADGTVVMGQNSQGVFRWTRDGAITPLGIAGRPLDVSSDGSVVVGNMDNGPAFRWTQHDGLQLISDGRGQAVGVSSDGSVATFTSQDGPTQAYRWESQTGAVSLGRLDSVSFARDLSADGRIVVGSSGAGTTSRPFRWTETTGMVALEPLPAGFQGGIATAVSADGSVVAGNLTLAGGGTGAGRWTESTGWVSLESPSTTQINTQSISGDGSFIIGTLGPPAIPSSAEPFIWDPNHGIQELTPLLHDHYGLAASLTGWDLGRAWDISEDGRAIVGAGIGPDGSAGWVAFLGTPVPEPSTMTMSALAFAVIVVWSPLRRRALRQLDPIVG